MSRRCAQHARRPPRAHPFVAALGAPCVCVLRIKRPLWSCRARCRRYPGVVTLPDGHVLVVGGTKDSGKAGYRVEGEHHYDNPSCE